MRYLPMKKVEAGMALAQDILDGQGVMLLGRHQILNQEQIENLDRMGYPGLYIDDKFYLVHNKAIFPKIVINTKR